jgi:hypothetical protein
MLEPLLQIIAGQQIWLLAFVIILVGISKAGFAGGLGVLATPLLLLQFPPKEALALLLPLLMITDVFTIKRYWQQWHWDLLKPLWPGAFVGVLLGALLLGQMNNDALRFGIGLMASLFAARSLAQLLISNTSVAITNKVPVWLSHGLAGLAGVSSTLLHAGGPPITMYLTLKRIPASQFIASSALFFTLLNWSKVPVFIHNDLLGVDTVVTALLLSPLCWLGTWCGVYIRSFMQESFFQYAVQILLLITGLKLIFQSF